MHELVVCQGPGRFQTKVDPEAISELRTHPDTTLWLNLDQPTAADIELLRKEFNFHPLALEDATRGHQRPKVDSYGDYYFVVFYCLGIQQETGQVCTTPLYLFIGSVIALVGALAMFIAVRNFTGVATFDMLQMSTAQQAGAFDFNVGIANPFTGTPWLSVGFEKLVFPFVFFGFAVLAGIFPFHNWSPDGHVAAPTAVSMFHAGVLMKLGAFAALRVGVQLLPEGAAFHMPWIVLLTLVNVVYGSFIAMTQRDLKYMIGFSSVSHMGLVAMALTTLNDVGYVGAGLQMFSHGVMTALFFAITGMIYDRSHTRQIPELGGMSKVMPFATIGFIIGGLVSMGMPGFSGFVAEFPIFMGVWGVQWLVAVIASTSIVITAAYIMRNIRQVFFGDMPEKLEGHMTDVTVLDKVAITTLCLFMIVIGLFPSFMVPMVQTGVENILRLLGGA